jgi:hypothetical protein
MIELKRQITSLERLEPIPKVDRGRVRVSSIASKPDGVPTQPERTASSGLNHNGFVTSIRGRTVIPGGACDFDLSVYHYSLSRPVKQGHDVLKLVDCIICGNPRGRCWRTQAGPRERHASKSACQRRLLSTKPGIKPALPDDAYSAVSKRCLLSRSQRRQRSICRSLSAPGHPKHVWRPGRTRFRFRPRLLRAVMYRN